MPSLLPKEALNSDAKFNRISHFYESPTLFDFVNCSQGNLWRFVWKKQFKILVKVLRNYNSYPSKVKILAICCCCNWHGSTGMWQTVTLDMFQKVIFPNLYSSINFALNNRTKYYRAVSIKRFFPKHEHFEVCFYS